MDYRAVWEDDPGGDAQIAYEAVKAMTLPVTSPLSSAVLNRWAAQYQVRGAIMQASENYSHPAYDAAAAARFALENTSEPLDLSDPGNQALLDTLVAGGLVSSAAALALTEMAGSTVPKYSNLDPEDIPEGRRMFGDK